MSHIQEVLNQQHHCKNLKFHDPIPNIIILIYANLNIYIFQNNEQLIRVHYNICLIVAVTNEWRDFSSQSKTLSPSALKMLWGEIICNFIQNW